MSIPTGHDVPLAVSINAPKTTVARVQIYINGYYPLLISILSISVADYTSYQYGKYISHIGPQTEFPIPPGIINNGGWNTIGVAIWAQGEAGAVLDSLELKAVGRFTSSFKFDFEGGYLQPGWTEERLKFA